MPLYHYSIGFPKKMKFRAVEGLVPSGHALREADSDRYGKLPIPTSFDPETWTVIEIEIVNGALDKVVARKNLDDKRDIVMVFKPLTKIIKTIWCNEKIDSHKTLDKSAYSIP